METCWLPVLDRHSIDVFIEAMASAPSAGCAIVTHEFKGAASRVATDATAFPLRRDHILVEIIASFADRSDDIEEMRHRQWARATREAFGAAVIPGGYPNLLAQGDTERAVQTYGGNAEWLIKAKRRYDPDNVFSSAIPLAGAQLRPNLRATRGRRHGVDICLSIISTLISCSPVGPPFACSSTEGGGSRAFSPVIP